MNNIDSVIRYIYNATCLWMKIIRYGLTEQVLSLQDRYFSLNVVAEVCA